MAVGQSYSSLPLTWNPKTGKNDQRWLRSIVQNSAPFSDGWTKARIVQLAHERPGKVKPQKIQELPEYGGYGSEAEIAEVLRSSLNLSEYSAFANQVNAEYVVKVLNSWHQQKFSQAVSRNFEVYADRERSNIFLVVSTAPTSLNAIRKLPPADRFRPLFNIKELGLILRQQQFKRLTLRTHGYSNPAEKFYDAFLQEAESISLKGPINYGGTLADQSAYIGYSWPGEEPFFTPGLWTDPRNNWEIFFKFLSVVALLAWIVGTVLYVLSALLIVPAMQWLGLQPILDPLWTWFNPQQIGSLFLQWQAVAFVVFALWLLLLQILRLVVYQRDRYRAIHYGAPDLAEFFWRLDKVLNDSLQSSMPFGAESLDRGSSSYLKVNLIGHSMGCLLVVNVLRILSDRFGKDDQSSDQQEEQIGNSLRLDHLILSSPDIPLEFLREGRNNYVRSAIRRCQQIYLISSDRDIVLRYLSMMGNWYSEPSLEMSGLRLGNLYLKPAQNGTIPNGTTEYQPYIRALALSQPAVEATSTYDLFEKFNYIDCSEMPEMDRTPWKLNWYNGLLIDALNTIQHLRKKIDVHGGQHWTEATSFQILQCLVTREDLSPEEAKVEIQQIIQGTDVKFLPCEMANFH